MKDESKKDGWTGPPGQRTRKIGCACCKTEFVQTEYLLLCDTIMGHKPVCSYECNKKLGQVK